MFDTTIVVMDVDVVRVAQCCSEPKTGAESPAAPTIFSEFGARPDSGITCLTARAMRVPVHYESTVVVYETRSALRLFQMTRDVVTSTSRRYRRGSRGGQDETPGTNRDRDEDDVHHT